jgi:hypothetical protein
MNFAGIFICIALAVYVALIIYAGVKLLPLKNKDK